MEFLIIALLVIFSIVVIIYPFLRKRTPSQPSSKFGPYDPTSLTRREEIYDEIKGLQLERELGSVQDEDYRERMNAYRVQAARALQEQDREFSDLDRALEEEILATRVGTSTDQRSVLCPSCGRGSLKLDGLCSHCGAALEGER
jgi:hypothetical protein